MEKLYIVSRRDLVPGAQLAQSVHAMREWTAKFPHEDLRWFESSNTLACLEVPDEVSLEALYIRALERSIPVARVEEPDFGNSLTALAIGSQGAKLVAQLPLALRQRKEGWSNATSTCT